MPTDAEVLNALLVLSKYIAGQFGPNVPTDLKQAISTLEQATTQARNAPIVNVSEPVKGSIDPPKQ